MKETRGRGQGLLTKRWSALAAVLVAASLVTTPALAQTSVSIESSPQLFATLCALYAAGYEAELGDTGANPLRARLRAEMAASQGPAVDALRKYYREHRLADPAATLSRFVSFAFSVGPPPKFEYTLSRDELPPDALALEGFNEVLANFYREAELDKVWQGLRPDYEREARRLQAPVNQIVFSTSGYLRELLDPSNPRRFSVYVEPLIGGKTNSRSYGDRYAIALNPGAELPLDEIRHTFLHFLIDPLPVRYKKAVEAKQPLLSYAGRAPRLPVEYKDGFPDFLGECLVRAAEIRLHKLPPAQAAAAVDEAERDGYVLVRPFVRELEKFEKAEPAMSFYFPDLVSGVNLVEEARRLEKVQFAPAREVVEHAENAPVLSETERLLNQGNRQMAQNPAGAATIFKAVLEREPENRHALYGLAVAAVMLREGEEAKGLFRRLVATPAGNPADAAAVQDELRIRAWSHVYLGRIHDVEGNRELAVSEYRAALAVEGAPEAARGAARKGIEQGYAAKKPEPGTPRP